MKRLIALLVVLIVVASGAILWFFRPSAPRSVTVSQSLPQQQTASAIQAVATSSPSVPAIRYEIVTRQAAQERGLGGRASIPDNYAMLFAFSADDTYGFWMKDMLTSIDMIWLADDGTIIKIDDSVSPDTYPSAFYPPQPVKYVLETKAGFAREKGWSIGTHVLLPAPY